jgi:hypothetical protein
MQIQQLVENLPNFGLDECIAATADTVVLMVSISCNYKDKIK